MFNRSNNGMDPEDDRLNGSNHNHPPGAKNGRAGHPPGSDLDEQLADFVDRLLASSSALSLQAVPETIDSNDPELARLQQAAVQLREAFSCGKDAPLPAGFQARLRIQLEAEWQQSAPARPASQPPAPVRQPPARRTGGRPSFQFGSPFAMRVAAYAVALLLIALLAFPSLSQTALPGASGLGPDFLPALAAIVLAALVGIALFFRRKP